jgi:hypothetical protein
MTAIRFRSALWLEFRLIVRVAPGHTQTIRASSAALKCPRKRRDVRPPILYVYNRRKFPELAVAISSPTNP